MKALKLMEEQQRIQKQMEEQERIKKQIEEQERIKKQMEEQQRIKKQMEEKQRIQKQMEEQERIKKQMEEQERIKKQMEEQQRIQKELLLKQQQENELKIKQQKELKEKMKKQKEEMEKLNKNIITCKSFIKPPLIGLENIGATCYMNATLQCFSQTELLTNYFLNENNKNRIINNNIVKKNPNNLSLSTSYLNLINNLWKQANKKWFSPSEFRIRLANMNPLFKEGLPNDAKDLVTYILTQLHLELNLYDGNNGNNNNNDNNNDIFNQFNENIVLNSFIQSFFSENRSILSDHFYGIQETKFICSGCQKRMMGNGILPMKYNFQTFNFLIFPLEEVRIYRNKMMMNNNMNINQMNMLQMGMNPMGMNPMGMNQMGMNPMGMNPMGMNPFGNNIIINNIFFQNNMNDNVVNIYECFEYWEKEEIFSGENAMWCNDCKGLFPSKNKTIIYSGPNILILILNRGVGIQFKIKLEYYESINLDKYIAKKDKLSMIYDLYGVVTHLGESGDGGHFVASCKSPCDNKWYRYNDALVNEIKDIQKDIINFGNSYILFYQKRI